MGRQLTIGEKIRFHRKASGLTLQQMEAITGINNGNLSRIERGAQNLTEPTLSKIAGAFGITLTQLLADFGDRISDAHQPGATTIPPHVFNTYKALADLPDGANILISSIAVTTNNDGRPAWHLNPDAALLFNSSQIKDLDATPAEMASFVNRGRSMEPRLFDGDSVICNMADTEVPEDGGVFVIMYDGELLVRRLFRRPGGGVIIKCDNQDYPSIGVLRAELESLKVIGRVKYRSGAGDF